MSSQLNFEDTNSFLVEDRIFYPSSNVSTMEG